MKSLIKYLALLLVVYLVFIRYSNAQSGELFVFAGNDTIVCLTTDSIEVFGYAENYHYVAWDKTGDGFFYNATSLKTAYVPGPLDIENQHITLFLVGISNQPWYSRMVDSVHITIVEPPMAYAGPDAIICEGESHQLNACTGHCSGILWETSGDGNFDNNQIGNPIYYPGMYDILHGEATLTLYAHGDIPCVQPASDWMKLTISKAPMLDAGQNATICEGNSVQLSAQAEFYDNIYWGTSGDGTFYNNTISNPKYYPGNSDIDDGQVQLIVLITPFEACGLYLVDSITLTIQNLPSAFSGPDRKICETEVVHCVANAENYESIQWMAMGGDGYFEDPHSLNTIYHPGNYEKVTGLFYILLNVFPAEPCLLPLNSFFEVIVTGQPEIYAGENITLCQQEEVLLEATGLNINELQWHTSGDGTFDDDSLVTNYYPGTTDLAQQQIQVWITANGISPCNQQVTDTIFIKFAFVENIYSEIADMEMPAGEAISLYFEVQSPGNGAYQWNFNNTPIENQQNPLLVIEDIAPMQAGSYHCIFSNDCVELSSDTAFITVQVEAQQEILLKQGWNGVSSYIIPINCSMETVLSPVINDIIILYNEDGIYSPYMDLMTIYEWQYRSGYITKTTAADTLIISGYIKYPPEPMVIKPGWSLFSSGCACNVSVDTLFSNHPQVNIIKEIDGLKIYWPEKDINTLKMLKPGKAYHILNSSTEELILTLPGFNN